MHSSIDFANVFGIVSQDIAALAGLFCLDTVERNALANELGYTVVVSSALSVLGILGLVRSSFKLALGLERCNKSGLSVDSLRSIYGYLQEEQASVGKRLECDVIDVKFADDSVCIRKTCCYYDSSTRPILKVGDDYQPSLKGKTLINLGNPVHEMSLIQHPVTVSLSAIITSGITPWLLAILGQSTWGVWVFGAMFSMHFALLSMIAIPLWVSFKLDRPGQAITSGKLNTLVFGLKDAGSMTFTQYPVNSGYGIFFHKKINVLQSIGFRTFVFGISLVCAVSYIAQFAILKFSNTSTAAIWVGCQAILAALRFLYSIVKRPYDVLGTADAESAVFENNAFDKLNLISLARSLPSGQFTVPLPIWNYLQETLLLKSVEDALKHAELDLDLDGENLFLLDLDFQTMLQHHTGPWSSWRVPWIIGLTMTKRKSLSKSDIQPRIFFENPELPRFTSYFEHRPPRTWCLPGEGCGSAPFAFKDMRTLSRTKKIGYVESDDVIQEPVDPRFANRAKTLTEGIFARQYVCSHDMEIVKMYLHTPAAVIRRDGDKEDGDREPGQTNVLYTKHTLRRLIQVVQEYIDLGHSRRKMSCETDQVFHPATAIRKILKLPLRSISGEDKRHKASGDVEPKIEELHTTASYQV